MPVLSDRYRGLAPTILVIFIVWAVAAVIMLTATLVAAQNINDKVNDEITGVVSSIDTDLNNVKLAARTDRIARRILEAATPLNDQLDVIITEAESIDRTVPQILDTARQINTTAGRINRNVVQIHGEVLSIGGTVGGIGGSVQGINASVRGIEGRLSAILDTAQGIDLGVENINTRAQRGIDIVAAASDDLHNVLNEVGPAGTRFSRSGRVIGGGPAGHRSGTGTASIHGHANSIDCQLQNVTFTTTGGIGGISLVFATGGRASQYCDQ